MDALCPGTHPESDAIFNPDHEYEVSGMREDEKVADCADAADDDVCSRIVCSTSVLTIMHHLLSPVTFPITIRITISSVPTVLAPI